MSATFEVDIATELARKLGWKYFHAIFGGRDQALLDLLEQKATALNMCLAMKRMINMQDLEEELEDAIENMLQYQGATVVMVFIPNIAIETLLEVASEKKTAGKLVFIIPKHVENIQTTVLKYKSPSLGNDILFISFILTGNQKSFFYSLYTTF